MSGNFEHRYPIKDGFNSGDYVEDLATKKIFKIVGLDINSWYRDEPDVVLKDAHEEQWVCHCTELHLRFKRLDNQKAARILYNNSVRGVK
jgi:hypothetical protein